MKITFQVDNEKEQKAAEQFISWLCGQGEQDYWNWMDAAYDGYVIQNFDYTQDLEIGCNRLKEIK